MQVLEPFVIDGSPALNGFPIKVELGNTRAPSIRVSYFYGLSDGKI
jgi:hypothetical protein